MKIAILLPILLAVVAAMYLGYNSPVISRQVSFQAPAVTDNGAGTMAGFKLWMRPGAGRILVNVDNAFYKEDSENSLKKATAIAERFVGLKMAGYDLILEADGERIVGGESAGTIFSAAIVSAFTGRKMREDATSSAAVTEDGTLVPVDGVEEKMRAASQAGKKYFVVAKSQQVNRELELSQKIRIVRAENAGQAIKLLLE